GGGAPVSSGAVPSGSARGNPQAAAAARAAAGGVQRADQSAGDLAGDRWTNRAPDLGRSTIPR
ncbi:hypothetical protein ACWEVD_31000, partial [Nocardia thailandica]